MIMVLDVGNTNMKFGLFIDGKLAHSWRLATDHEVTSDSLGIEVFSFFNYLGLKPGEVKKIIVSSVIPSLNYTVAHMCHLFFHQKPVCVGPGVKTGLNILYDNPKEVGADRIVNAVAAYTLYGGPVITVDFGTATSFGAVSAQGDFLGGVISPGLKISAEALTVNAAKLPHVDLIKPKTVINKSTITCMQAGIFYGYVGLVDYILRKMKRELGGKARVVATGGLSDVICSETSMVDVVDSLLTLEGLYIIYQKNFADGPQGGTHETH